MDDEKITADPTVKIDSEKIGGPSAGLMFSLEIYSRFQKNDLTDGKKSPELVRLTLTELLVESAELIKRSLPQIKAVRRFSLLPMIQLPMK